MFIVHGKPMSASYVAAQIHHLWVEDSAKKLVEDFFNGETPFLRPRAGRDRPCQAIEAQARVPGGGLVVLPDTFTFSNRAPLIARLRSREAVGRAERQAAALLATQRRGPRSSMVRAGHS
jgi:hypothetical protein